MPATAKITRVVRLFTHLDDTRIERRTFDEFMGLQIAEAATEGEVLLRRQMLVVEEDDLMLEAAPAVLVRVNDAGVLTPVTEAVTA